MRHKTNKMSAKHVIVLFLVEFVLFTHCQQAAKFFRKDYQYIESTKAFYKTHTTYRTWAAAKERCEFEGAKLFYPTDEDEVMSVIDFWNRTQNFPFIWIGISTPNVKEVFETIDGLAIWQVYDKWHIGEPNNLGGEENCVTLNSDATMNDDHCDKVHAFICKKTLDSLVWNTECNLHDQSYVYSPQGRCYKFHLEPRSWADAVTICNAEQSYLAIINSDEEAELLANITQNAQKDLIEDTDFLNGSVHLGFKFDRRWRTLKGESLLKSGYAKWGTGRPDGKSEGKCGSMFYDGKLNDIACSQKCFFICEHEPAFLNADYDFRFGQTTQSPAPVCSSSSSF